MAALQKYLGNMIPIQLQIKVVHCRVSLETLSLEDIEKAELALARQNKMANHCLAILQALCQKHDITTLSKLGLKVGKLKADQWHSVGSIHLVITLIHLWGNEGPSHVMQTYPFERFNLHLQSVPTNAKSGSGQSASLQLKMNIGATRFDAGVKVLVMDCTGSTTLDQDRVAINDEEQSLSAAQVLNIYAWKHGSPDGKILLSVQLYKPLNATSAEDDPYCPFGFVIAG
ncbi:predicted protein [Postia placenta Mad-698-R]|uniref:Uncharacterized protein n=1 Tax=Postia placenta MAD-698-R-SB12 TaxID=670580 RepID=A0A1X6MWM7_9APHY|nr:hypothetical protein POSPLADRAFT_1048032 [Postia placenta MAD-698-R-SB12]EED84395.1 predicted protein [Postia placenta Mad-698-R]OSX60636.1 hypothetical protein POSPLADRAFT_1048032 [Postia placenta MAD-698-R-SB12]